MISHVDTVIAYVSDQPKIVGFFVEALGFEMRADAEMRPGRRWMEVAPPGAQTTLAVLAAADFGRAPDESYPLTLASPDLEATGDTLRKARVQLGDIVDESWGRYRMVTDPEGRQIMIAAQVRE